MIKDRIIGQTVLEFFDAYDDTHILKFRTSDNDKIKEVYLLNNDTFKWSRIDFVWNEEYLEAEIPASSIRKFCYLRYDGKKIFKIGMVW